MMINTHQLLTAMDAMFEQFEDRIHVLEMERHPLYLLEHWMSYIDMHGTKARDLTAWVDDKKGQAVPWFAHEWRDDYWSLPKFDRVILSMESLIEGVDEKYKTQPASRLMVVPFEDFTLSTDKYIDRIAQWIGTERTTQTEKLCRKQNLPRKNINAGLNKKIYQRYGYRDQNKAQSHEESYKEKLNYAKTHQSSVSAPVLKKLIERYEMHHGLWF